MVGETMDEGEEAKEDEILEWGEDKLKMNWYQGKARRILTQKNQSTKKTIREGQNR